MIRLAIIGSKDLGQLIAYHARTSEDFEVVGFFDDFAPEGEVTPEGPVLGKIDQAVDYFSNREIDHFLMGVGYSHLEFRWNCYEKLKQTIHPATLVHSSCYVDPSVNLSPGCVLLPGCVLDKGAKLGENTLLNTSVSIAHDTSVGNNCFLGPGVNLTGLITVGDHCFLGAGTTVIEKLNLGDHTQTGAGAVVTQSLSEPGLYVGVPAKKIK